MTANPPARAKASEAKFVIIPALPYTVRVVLILALIVGGIAVQLLFSWLIPGIVMVALGSLMGCVRSVESKPDIPMAGGEWIEVLPEQWQRARDLAKNTKSWKSDITNLGSGTGATLAMFLAIACIGLFGAMIDVDPVLTVVFLGNVVALFGPLLLVGHLKAWEPPRIGVKLKALQNVLDWLEGSGRPDLAPQPMMEVVKGEIEGGEGVPLDARMMVRFKDAPEGFYGVQVQVSINVVQNAAHPYLYAVILYSADLDIDFNAAGLPREKWLDVEPSREQDVVVIVVRQHTTKTSGYETKEPRQIEIVDAAVQAARRMLESLR